MSIVLDWCKDTLEQLSLKIWWWNINFLLFFRFPSFCLSFSISIRFCAPNSFNLCSGLFLEIEFIYRGAVWQFCSIIFAPFEQKCLECGRSAVSCGVFSTFPSQLLIELSIKLIWSKRTKESSPAFTWSFCHEIDVDAKGPTFRKNCVTETHDNTHIKLLSWQTTSNSGNLITGFLFVSSVNRITRKVCCGMSRDVTWINTWTWRHPSTINEKVFYSNQHKVTEAWELGRDR